MPALMAFEQNYSTVTDAGVVQPWFYLEQGCKIGTLMTNITQGANASSYGLITCTAISTCTTGWTLLNNQIGVLNTATQYVWVCAACGVGNETDQYSFCRPKFNTDHVLAPLTWFPYFATSLVGTTWKQIYCVNTTQMLNMNRVRSNPKNACLRPCNYTHPETYFDVKALLPLCVQNCTSKMVNQSNVTSCMPDLMDYTYHHWYHNCNFAFEHYYQWQDHMICKGSVTIGQTVGWAIGGCLLVGLIALIIWLIIYCKYFRHHKK